MNVTGKWSAPKSLDIRQGREDLESLAPNLPSRASQRPFLTAAPCFDGGTIFVIGAHSTTRRGHCARMWIYLMVA